MNKLLLLILGLTITSSATKPKEAPNIKPPAGRLAILADGNSPDPDDLGGTAVSLALLRAAGLGRTRCYWNGFSGNIQRIAPIHKSSNTSPGQ